jgi:lantibiotic modifying enzyme
MLNNKIMNKSIKKYLYHEMLLHNNTLDWQTGFTNGKYCLNGLMLGSAGIGYGLLKTFWYNHIPSVLTLETVL